MADGYLPEAVINYIALLGWCPKSNQEIFTLKELCDNFHVDEISKSPSVFDYDKLAWMNSEYLRDMTPEQFAQVATPYFEQVFGEGKAPSEKLTAILQQRTVKLTDIPPMIEFFVTLPEYDKELYVNKKSKTNLENAPMLLKAVYDELKALENWNCDAIKELLISMAERMELKNGTIMWPARIAVAGKTVTPGGAVEILDILGKEESMRRMEIGLAKLEA